MKQVSLTALLLLLAAAGCQHPTQVELKPEAPDEQVDVAPLVVVDTSIYQNDLDSSAVSPEDQARFAGFLLATRVTFDDGRTLQARTFAKILFNDLTRPIQIGGRTVGFFGFGLRAPAVNGFPMLPVLHGVRLGPMHLSFGFEYVREFFSASAWPDSVVTWHVGADTLGAIDVSIKAPPLLSVASPAGGSSLSRNQDLKLRWTGAGDIKIYLSAIDPQSKRSRPLLKITPAGNRGHALLPAALLRALPPRERFFMFTFVLANRKESVPVARFRDGVLAQAATVYNCYVEFR
jgi:hypothetical protein